MDGTAQAIEALRAAGAQRIDPVRLRHIEALARRAAGHQGAVRQQLEARLAELLAACEHELRDAATAEAPPQPAPQSPLAELLAHIARQDGSEGTTPPPELKALRQHRDGWTRLHLDLRITQALAQVPDNAGPLNTQRLLNQALQRLHQLAPQYLQQLVAQVEALLWLDQARLPGERRTAARQPKVKRAAS